MAFILLMPSHNIILLRVKFIEPYSPVGNGHREIGIQSEIICIIDTSSMRWWSRWWRWNDKDRICKFFEYINFVRQKFLTFSDISRAWVHQPYMSKMQHIVFGNSNKSMWMVSRKSACHSQCFVWLIWILKLELGSSHHGYTFLPTLDATYRRTSNFLFFVFWRYQMNGVQHRMQSEIKKRERERAA